MSMSKHISRISCFSLQGSATSGYDTLPPSTIYLAMTDLEQVYNLLSTAVTEALRIAASMSSRSGLALGSSK